MRYQLKLANTLAADEYPMEGEAFWDDVGRRIGFFNRDDQQFNWFRIPATGEDENYVPRHSWDGQTITFWNPDGTPGLSVDLTGPEGRQGIFPEDRWRAELAPYRKDTVLFHNGALWLSVVDAAFAEPKPGNTDWTPWLLLPEGVEQALLRAHEINDELQETVVNSEALVTYINTVAGTIESAREEAFRSREISETNSAAVADYATTIEGGVQLLAEYTTVTEQVRDESIAAKDTAVAAKDAAVTAKDAAVTAKDASIAARDVSVTNAQTATTKANEASASASVATTQANLATTEANRSKSEADRSLAAALRSEAADVQGMGRYLNPLRSASGASKALDFTLGNHPRDMTFQRASTGTYFDGKGVLRTALNDQMRFDHDPLTGEPLGVLIEEQKTNLFLQSSNFDNAVWGTATATRDRTHTAPDGSNEATLWTVRDENSNHIVQSVTLPSANSAFSIFVKAGSAFTLTMRYFGFDTNIAVKFDLSSGVVSDPAIGRMEALSNGWFRCSIMPTMQGTDLSGVIYAYLATNAEASFSADIGNSMYVWGAQVEEGPFPTSYIPTTTAATTRAADTLLTTLEGEWFNRFGSTFIVDIEPLMFWRDTANSANSRRHLFTLMDVPGGSNFLYVCWQPNSDGTFALAFVTNRTGGSVKIHQVGSSSNIQPDSPMRVAFTIDGVRTRISINGATAIGIDDLDPDLNTMQLLYIGQQGSSPVRMLNDRMKSLIVIPTLLSDIELRARSAP